MDHYRLRAGAACFGVTSKPRNMFSFHMVLSSGHWGDRAHGAGQPFVAVTVWLLGLEALFAEQCSVAIPARLWVVLNVSKSRQQKVDNTLRLSSCPRTLFFFPSWVCLGCFVKKHTRVLIVFGCAEAEKKTCSWNQIPWNMQTAHGTLHQAWQSVVLQNL